jgi:repressor LexA
MNKRECLTERQRILLGGIKDFIKANGYTPSQRDLARTLDCSLNTIQELLIRLERKHYITHAPGVSRSLRVLRSNPEIQKRAA